MIAPRDPVSPIRPVLAMLLPVADEGRMAERELPGAGEAARRRRDDEERRLARALRENLLKRKRQSRERADPSGDPAD